MNSGKKIVSLFLLCVSSIFISNCSQKEKLYHVGILSGINFFAAITDGFKEKMTELGYVEGKNIIYDVQKKNLDIPSYREVLKKFVNDKVDLIFVFPTDASLEAKLITQGTKIPVVFANALIEEIGLIDSVREPGGNITGVRWPGPDMALQRLEIMRELLPKAKRILVPYQRSSSMVKSQLEVLRQTSFSTGLILTELPADTAEELEAALKKEADSANHPDAILNIVEPFVVQPDTFMIMAKFAAKLRIPIGGAFNSSGGYESVFGLLPQNIPQGRQAAFLADKVLKAVPAGSIPVVSAESFLQINYKAAQKLGLKISSGLLSRANKVIR